MSIAHQKTKVDDKTVILHLETKELNQQNSSDMKQLLWDQLTAGYSTIILDLSAVKDVDSSGLSAFLFGNRQALARGGGLLLVKANEKVQSLIRIAQLTRVLQLFDSVEEAMKAIQGE